MESTEKWLPVPGWEGWYEVSDHGRVRSLDRVVPHATTSTMASRGQMLRPSSDPYRRLRVNFWKNSVCHTHLVHRLVLEAFVGPCPPGMEACHWDDDPTNNHLSNLRWDTPSENELDKVRNGGHHMSQRTHCPRDHDLSEPNITAQARRDGRRECLACSRERGNAHYYGRPFDPARADEHYRKIVSQPIA